MRLVSLLLLGVVCSPALAAQPATVLAPTMVSPTGTSPTGTSPTGTSPSGTSPTGTPPGAAPGGAAVAATPATQSGAPGAADQHDRMRRCNAQARERDVHGAPRREFMRGCLSGKAPEGGAAASGPAPAGNAPPSFPSEAAAHAACGPGVVWGNVPRHLYHLPGSRYFGKTRSGAFLCQAAADAAGFHAAGRHAGTAAH